MHSRLCTCLLALAAAVGLLLVAPATAPAVTLHLHQGSRGSTVRLLEARLHTLRLLPARQVDRYFGPTTTGAVKRFQRTHRLRATGHVGPTTWSLIARAARPTPPPPPPPPPAPAPAPAPAPLILGHRGAVVASVAENTLQSMQYAAGSADVLEFDLRLTQDRQLVLMHDADLDRTTTCRADGGVPVASVTYAYLQEHCPTLNGEPVPTFEQVAQLAQDRGLRIAPQLSPAGLTDEDLAGFVDTLTRHGLVGRSYVQAFYPSYFPRLQARVSGLHFVYLAPSTTAPATIRSAGASIAGINMVGLTSQKVAAYQRAGLAVWAFTALTVSDLRSLRAMRVNGVFTNIPVEARALYHPGG